MASLGDDLAAELMSAIEDYEQEFSWRGQIFPCVKNTHNSTLLVAKSLFPAQSYPPRGESILIDGQFRQVVSWNGSGLKFSSGGLVETKPFVDDPSDPALLIEFGKLITS